MKVLILNGSPRASGNTSKMVEAFAKTARNAGHEVVVFQIGNKTIRGCRNCNACRKTLNGECVQRDDMQAILSEMRECEVLVLASPIYYYSMAGQLHCAIERMYSFERLPNLKEAALLLSAAGGGFTSAIATYQDAILGHMGARNLGIVRSIGEVSERTLEEVRKTADRI